MFELDIGTRKNVLIGSKQSSLTEMLEDMPKDYGFTKLWGMLDSCNVALTTWHTSLYLVRTSST
jgi:hypothetical protein